VENYFNYFTEIEEHFQRRRGTALLLSTLDWALIETWKDAGIPLEAVLRGIDETFDKYERRPARARKVNSLAYCAQEVLAAAADVAEAALGTEKPERKDIAAASGLSPANVAAYLHRNADALERAPLPEAANAVKEDTVRTLRELAEGVSGSAPARMEDVERRLTVLEEKLLAALTAAAPDGELLAARAQAEREMAPFRRKIGAAQAAQLEKQFLHKRLLEQHNLPRLSLFYL
jgi:hypothetical protein